MNSTKCLQKMISHHGVCLTGSLVCHQFIFLGEGDWHDSIYDNRMKTVTFNENYLDPVLAQDMECHCRISLDVYSSAKFEEAHDSSLPFLLTAVVGGLFAIMAVVFGVYDLFVQSRNRRVVKAAAQSNAIVAQVFPSAIRKKMMEEAAQQKKTLKGFLSSADNVGIGPVSSKGNLFDSNPIADFFPDVTVIFADIGK